MPTPRGGEIILNAASSWSIAGLTVLASMAILVVPLFLLTRKASPADAARLRKIFAIVAVVIAVPLAALGVRSLLGDSVPPAAPAAVVSADDIATSHARTAMQIGANAGDLGAAIERLRARLAEHPGDVNGWRLLAQSYRYLGREAEAAEADKMAEAASKTAPGAGSDIAPPASFATPAGGTAHLAPLPSTRTSAEQQLVQRAEEHRRRREFHQANEIFSDLARAGQMDADLWADYADSLGGENGSLNERAAECIDAALRLEPDHAKALWLLGSLQTQRGDHAAALATWQKLAAIFPAGSSDARIIAANIEETRAKLAGSRVASPVAAARAATLRGTVQLDPRWRSHVPEGATLFVLARAADERGPPLAVVRATAGTWPFKFTLDDANAMLPDRRLSGFKRVIVEARISRSGNPIAQPGDLHAVSAVLDPHTAGEVRLTIDTEVPPLAAQGG